jgi:hypothetical protein
VRRSAKGELDGIGGGGDVDGTDAANAVLGRREAGAELGGGFSPSFSGLSIAAISNLLR